MGYIHVVCLIDIQINCSLKNDVTLSFCCVALPAFLSITWSDLSSHSRKLVYPFSIPIGASYVCQTESTITVSAFSNPNRFMQIGNSTAPEVIADEVGSPVIQFTGIHVSVCIQQNHDHSCRLIERPEIMYTQVHTSTVQLNDVSFSQYFGGYDRYSYAYEMLSLFPVFKKKEHVYIMIKIISFPQQIQAYGYSYTQYGVPVFSTIYECHGYFTLPSWMGVFSVVILLTLLYISIVFAFSIQTVDRFEDPRAPTISVENLH